VKSPLPLTLDICDGESFQSWIERLAHRLHLGLAEMLHSIGISPTEDFRAIPTGFFLDLPENTISKVAWLTGQDPERLSGALLSSYRGVVLSKAWKPRRSMPVTWVHQATSLACPCCIRDGVWRLAWKLPWSVACPEHRLFLASACPRCTRPLGGNMVGGICRPAFGAKRPLPGRCLNASPNEPGSRRINRCEYLLSDLAVLPADDVIIRAQQMVDRVIEARSGTLFGAEAPSLMWFGALRSVVALLSWAALPEDLHLPHEEMQVMLAGHADARQRHSEQRERIRTESGGRWRGPAMRHWGVVPRDPLFMGALLPTALDVITGSLDGDRPVLDLLAERVKARRWRGTDNAYAQFHTPKALSTELVRRSARLLRFAVGAAEVTIHNLEARHIPTLFWPTLYEERIRPLFTSAIGERQGRRFASIALSRLLGGGTWKEAEQRVVQPLRVRGVGVSRLQRDLRDNGTEQAFRAVLEEIAEELGEHAEQVDFQGRRETFATWAIPEDDWGRICGLAGMNLGGRTRRRCASAWCWGELTACPWEDAPVWSGGWPDQNARNAFRKLVNAMEGPAGGALATYVAAVLGGDRTAIDAAPPGLHRVPSRSFADARPDLAPEWDPVRNGTLTASHLSPKSNRKVWWLCSYCGRSWQAPLVERIDARCAGCLTCRGPRGRKPLSSNSYFAVEWHPTRNGVLTPDVVGRTSHRLIWWRCACGEEWQATVRARTRTAAPGCRRCRGLVARPLSVDPELSAEWHPTRNGELTPADVLQWSPTSAWWLCPCGREWRGSIRSRTVTRRLRCRECRRTDVLQSGSTEMPKEVIH
jgi:hypothetical protein